MSGNCNENQIIRKEVKNYSVEAMKDGFTYGKIHLSFAAYDTSKPVGQRQTDSIHVYLAVEEFLELCRKLESGDLKKQQEHCECVLFRHFGGTSARKLSKLNRPRSDGMSLSRTMKIVAGQNMNFLLVANSGPGELGSAGIIAPMYGEHPENHVVISLSHDELSGFLLTIRAHYQAWLSAEYVSDNCSSAES